MRDIEELRKEIDSIDKELVELFERRMNVVKEVATYKINTNKPLKDPEREAELIKKNVALLDNPEYERLLSVFFKDIMEYSRSYQQTIIGHKATIFEEKENATVVFQGVEGSFSSIALHKFFTNVKTTSRTTFEETFKALYNEEADYAILPIENSSTGAINQVYDLLLKYDMSIVGDVYLKIRHHLIGKGPIESIKAVYSHEQGFKQSQTYLSQKAWDHFTYANTAESVKHVKSLNDSSYAAIASQEAAKLYEMDILEENIHDHDYNTTRFIVLSKDKVVDNNANKISLVLRLSHEPKALFKVLETIANQSVNMLKIESRPIPDKPWAYMFYIDIEGALEDPIIQDIMTRLQEVTHTVMILGNYYSRNGVSE